MKRTFRFTLYLIGYVGFLYLSIMSITYPDESWMIYTPFSALVPGWGLAAMMGWLVLTVIAILMIKKPPLRLVIGMHTVTLLISLGTLMVQMHGVSHYFIETSPTQTQILIREHPSWLSTEIDFFFKHPLLGWIKVGEDESTADQFLPFTTGDYTLTWSASEVEITWLFDNDLNTYHTVVLPLSITGESS